MNIGKLWLSPALIAIVSLVAFSVASAAADTGGHFTSEVSSTKITGTESGTHILAFAKEGEENKISCLTGHYHGHVNGTTAEDITVTPTYSTCTTASSESHFEVHENGCHYVFTIGDTGSHHTVHIVCPIAPMRITHPNCTMSIPSQTLVGVTYGTIVENAKHAITLEATVQDVTTHYEGGICVFLGTTHQSEISGGGTVQGFDSNTGNQVSITATTK
jgi:hypothetical protein